MNKLTFIADRGFSSHSTCLLKISWTVNLCSKLFPRFPPFSNWKFLFPYSVVSVLTRCGTLKQYWKKVFLVIRSLFYRIIFFLFMTIFFIKNMMPTTSKFNSINIYLEWNWQKTLNIKNDIFQIDSIQGEAQYRRRSFLVPFKMSYDEMNVNNKFSNLENMWYMLKLFFMSPVGNILFSVVKIAKTVVFGIFKTFQGLKSIKTTTWRHNIAESFLTKRGTEIKKLFEKWENE